MKFFKPKLKPKPMENSCATFSCSPYTPCEPEKIEVFTQAQTNEIECIVRNIVREMLSDI